MNVSAKLAQKKTSSAALLANGERCTDEGAARALDRDHGIPISLCCRMRMVVVTGSNFEILGFFLPRESRISRLHCFGKIAARSCAESYGDRTINF